MKLSTLVAPSLFVALCATAAQATPEVRLLGQPTLAGDCNDQLTEVRLVQTDVGPTFDILVPSLDAEADDSAPRVRKFCNIRQAVEIPYGYKLAPRNLKYQGLVDISAEGGSGNISARYYLSGTEGLNGFRAFHAGEQGNFDVDTWAGAPSYTACGGVAELNFLADMTARIRPGYGSYSQVTIDRGIGDVDLDSLFHCGVQIVPCH